MRITLLCSFVYYGNVISIIVMMRIHTMYSLIHVQTLKCTHLSSSNSHSTAMHAYPTAIDPSISLPPYSPLDQSTTHE
jgi:hypothetical protein